MKIICSELVSLAVSLLSIKKKDAFTLKNPFQAFFPLTLTNIVLGIRNSQTLKELSYPADYPQIRHVLLK